MGNHLEALRQDLRHGARILVKNPSFTLTALLTLGLGIGANTAIFSVVNAVLLRPLPYPEPERLVALREFRFPGNPDVQVAPGDFLEWQRQNTVFSQLAAYRTVSYNITGDGNPERVLGGRASAGLFTMLGATPALGRDFLPEEDQPSGERAVLISDGLWRRRFGADAGIIGKTLKMSGENFTVVGVLPGGFRLPDFDRELWTPMAFTRNERELHNAHYIEAIGRLKPEATLGMAQAEMTTIAGRLGEQYPDANSGWDVHLTRLADFEVRDVKAVLWILAGAVGFVLLIVCVNVANLLLARAAVRQKEMAIRSALGAGRLRLVRQLMTESVLLAVMGGLAGWPLAVWGLKALMALAPRTLPRAGAVSIDQRALLFTLGIAIMTGLVFGLAPALQLSKLDLTGAMKNAGGGGSRGPRPQRIRDLLIIAEIALALVLLIGGGLLLDTLWQLRRVDPGFDYHNTVAVTLQLSEKKYTSDQEINMFTHQLLDRVTTLSGVQSAGIARILPIIHDLPAGFYIEGRPREKESELPRTNYSAVSPDYFKAMGIPVLRGRAFSDRDAQGAPRVAIISEKLAQRFFPDGDAIGKRLNVVTGPEAFREIVGIVGDVKQNGLDRETRPHTYEPFAQAPNQFMTLVVRGTSEAGALVPAIRGQVLEIDSDQPLQSVRTLEEMLSNSIRQQRFTAVLLSIFAAAALLLAGAGLYGVISYSVTQREREIGIRVALGARPGEVLRMVVADGMKLTLIGLGIGLVASLSLARVMSGLLFGVTATDPLAFGGLGGLLLGVALLACYVPARRATRVHPLVALRYE